MLALSDSDFKRLVTFVKSTYGIDLSQKRQLICGRLTNTITALGMQSFTEYIDHILSKKSTDDIDGMLNKLTTNYTYFMREEAHFNFFRNNILPWLESTKKNRVLSIWSAGCSSGQEPYTLSMIIKEYFGTKASLWDTRILATDISQNVLAAATEGIYDGESLSKLPDSWRNKYFHKTNTPDMYQVSPELRQNVIFKTFNLMDPIRFKLKFDVIFCRNVMIYFDQKTKDTLVQNFYNTTVPGGYLLIGHSESLNKATTPYQYVQPSLYRKIQN